MTITIRAITAAVAACTTATALAAATASSASAHQSDDHGHAPRVLNSTVIAPFGMAVSGQDVWYTDGFVGTVNKISRGTSQVVTRGPQSEVAGIDVIRGGRTYAFTSSNDDHSATTLTIRSEGRPDVVADLSGYEASANPDAHATYGVVSGGTYCAPGELDTFFQNAFQLPATYTGQVDSHPYAVTYLGDGSWAVADAGGNDILRVDRHGHVSTIAVLPPQPVTLSASQVATLGAPSCLAGATYNFEPVPTDVERGTDGRLWVTTLPGGPEDPSLGARGSVYTVNPWKHSSKRVATGFLGATNLALGHDGAVYVAELFAGKVTKLKHGRTSTVVSTDRPLSVEVKGGSLYVGTLADITFGPTGPVVNAPGSITRYRL
ncbi:ScyD/ScyE family protein [Terrabacter sp. Ter38]|uniref:ScyD/ScyE family protein n=1 Tax=Terrabacter sp. Ter38 TaxID=2926030 RepID=UPI0021199732|nr:ScyD/ScyE family protein [Terrabacter sp. Ter38]